MTFKTGQRIDALFDGGDEWYPGVISVAHTDGCTFDIDYDDSEQESSVHVDLIRTHVMGTLSIGTRIQVQVQGGTEITMGVIQYIDDDFCFDILYENGKEDVSVPLEWITELEQVVAEEAPINVMSVTNDAEPSANQSEELTTTVLLEEGRMAESLNEEYSGVGTSDAYDEIQSVTEHKENLTTDANVQPIQEEKQAIDESPVNIVEDLIPIIETVEVPVEDVPVEDVLIEVPELLGVNVMDEERSFNHRYANEKDSGNELIENVFRDLMSDWGNPDHQVGYSLRT